MNLPRESAGRFHDAWKNKSATHLSHLNFNSLQFAMCLREDNPRKKSTIHSSDDSTSHSDEAELPKSNCPKTGCQNCQEEIIRLLDKKAIILKKLDKISRELNRVTESLSECEDSEREAVTTHAALDNELTKLRMMSLESKLSDKLSSIKNEGLELKRQIDLRAIELRRLKSKQTNYLPSMTMNTSQSTPLFQTSELIIPPKPLTNHRKFGNRIHNGVYKRSASTNWNLSWSCCLNPSKDSVGCSVVQSKRFSHHRHNNNSLSRSSSVQMQFQFRPSEFQVSQMTRPMSAQFKSM